MPDDPAATPSTVAVLLPAAGLVVLLLLVVLVASPGALLVRVTTGPESAPTRAQPATPSGPAALPRADPGLRPADQGVMVAAGLEDLLRTRDAAVVSGREEGWPATGPAEPDEGSFAVLTSLPVTRFQSSLVPDTLELLDGDAAAGEGADATGADRQTWQGRVETVYELADGPAVQRTDTVVVRLAEDGVPGQDSEPRLQVVSWTPYPEAGEIGTAAPWDLGPVTATVGERAVVLSWNQEDEEAPAEAALAWGEQVVSWADTGAVTVDSYVGTGWPRLSLVLVPATSQQYAELVPGPRPAVDDVFAAVTTDVETTDGSGDVVVLNPSARDQLVEETWQVTVTHELVHVASGARYGDSQEIWLAEGFADLVGWSAVVPGTVEREVVAARLLERVAAGTADVEDLPDADDFGSADADVVGDAYEGAWLAAMLLEDEIGTDALLTLYGAASEGEATSAERTERALREATGSGREAFVARWGDHLRALAAG